MPWAKGLQAPWRWLLAWLFALPLAGHAQHVDLGLKGGVNRDDLRSTYAHESLIGGHAGLFARWKAPVYPGVQGEVLLSSFGSRVTVEGVQGDLRSLAVQLPLFMVLSLGPAELHAGGYYERYLTQELATAFNVDLNDLPVEAGQLHPDGYGLLLGAGLRFGHFYLGARYNMGMRDIGSGPYLSDVRTRQFHGYVGFGFFKPPVR